MFDQDDLAVLPESARVAIRNALERVERASAAGDVELAVGTSKELVETVAKVAINSLGGSYGSNAEVPTLTHELLKALALHPAALSDRPSLRRLAQSLASTVNALAELRNTDGTGHGRAVPSNLDPSHATLARDTSINWSRWVLAATRRALRDRVPIAQVVDDIAGPLTFTRGSLPALLQELRLPQRAEDDQMKLGLAVARRWTVNGTFLPREDVIKPLAAGEAEYPPAFAEGVLEGLLLDHNGYLRIHPDDLPLVVAIAKRLPGDRRERALRELTARVKDALLSYTFGDEDQAASTTSLWRLADESMAEEGETTTLWEFLTSIASRIEALQESEPSYALDEDYEDGEDD